MARITVEDCLSKIDSQYDLVLLAKERALQLNAGDKPLVPENNDKNTVISLREIGDGKISIKTIEDSAINKLRKAQSEPVELEDLEVDATDDFENIYKGEISKSGAAILPSKRTRKMPDKIVTRDEVEKEKIKEEIQQADQKVEQQEEQQADQKVEDETLNSENKTE
jgi:DNA-directed RNA polymerase subunit omega